MTVEEALAWIAEVLDEPPTSVNANTARKDLTKWDSLGQLLLLSALDQEFGIRMTPDEVREFSSVQSILTLLEKHGRLRMR